MIVIVMLDYGDMFGECGFWYKMMFFEGGCCVLLIVYVLGCFDVVCVCGFVLYVDLLLMFVELVGVVFVGGWLDLVDGVSFVLYLYGMFVYDVVFGEYFVEGVFVLVVMICCGDWKYVYCLVDFD